MCRFPKLYQMVSDRMDERTFKNFEDLVIELNDINRERVFKWCRDNSVIYDIKIRNIMNKLLMELVDRRG